LPTEPIWLAESDIIHINKRLVEKAGGQSVLRDRDSLSRSLANVVGRWADGEDSIASLAGVVLLEIGKNRPFEQGNKRTAMASAAVFLMRNGHTFAAPSGPVLGQFVERAILGEIPEDAFLSAMRRATVTTEAWNAFQRGEVGE
jgi:death on curing protein